MFLCVYISLFLLCFCVAFCVINDDDDDDDDDGEYVNMPLYLAVDPIRKITLRF